MEEKQKHSTPEPQKTVNKRTGKKSYKMLFDKLCSFNQKIKTELQPFFQKIIFDKCFYLTVLSVAFFSFSFSLFNTTVSVDDLARQLWVGNGKMMIKGCRWFIVVLSRLFSTPEYIPFIDDAVALVFLVLSSISVCSVFYLLSRNENKWVYIIVSSVYCSYPLIIEIWEYTVTSTALYASILFLSIGIAYFLLNDDYSLADYSIVSLFLVPAVAGYESAMFFYISFVFIILFYNTREDKNYKWFSNGIRFSIPLFIAIVIKFGIGYLLILMNNVSYASNGASNIGWLGHNLYRNIVEITTKNIDSYFLSINYLPILEFDISLTAFLFFLAKEFRNNKNSFVVGLFLLFSLFLQSFLQGQRLPYRTAQTIQLFVSFTAFLIYSSSFNNMIIQRVFIVFGLFIVFRQCVCLNEMLVLNNQRYNNEAETISYIGNKIYSEYDISKPVVFCGKYHLGDFLDNNARNRTESGVKSCINWALRAFDNQDMIRECFAYYGYDLKLKESSFNRDVNHKYEDIAISNGMNPLSIKDMGDYILVYFGKID